LSQLNQIQQTNGASFLSNSSSHTQQSQTNNNANMLLGQGIYNNNMQHMAQANPGTNPQLMNFTFNNFNTHNHLNGGVQQPISMD